MRDKDCSLIMTVMKWRNGTGAATCEPSHGQANKGIGVVKSFINRIWPFEGELATDVIVDIAAPETTAPNPRCVQYF